MRSLFDTIDHRSGGSDLCLPDCAGRLHIDNDRVVEVDQVVRRVGEEGVPFEGACPLRRRI